MRVKLCATGLLITGLLFGQQPDSSAARLIGKWELVRHTLLERGKLVDKLTPTVRVTYEFTTSGAYTCTYWNQGSGTVTTAGRWKMDADGKHIRTFTSRFLPPHDVDGIVGDHPLTVIELTRTRFVTNEYLYSEAPAGTSYYERRGQ